jgi:predicted O-methyltransferase YrrM
MRRASQLPACSPVGQTGMKPSRILQSFADLAALAASTALAPAAKLVARSGPERLPRTYRFWDLVGVAPIRYEFYQPVVLAEQLPPQTWERQELAGIDLNGGGQLQLLISLLEYRGELESIPGDQPEAFTGPCYNNSMFASPDAEIYYSLIRHFNPKRVVEVGSGYSTLFARCALDANGNDSELICIEPFPREWLCKVPGVKLVQRRVEELPLEFFGELGENDILFIDSSHVVRVGGDVCFAYLEVIPSLRPGVLIHAHDIFLPYSYPRHWLTDHRRYWTEQYLLQALLQGNSRLQVLLALQFLHREHRGELARACPVYASQPERNPGSFWMRCR